MSTLLALCAGFAILAVAAGRSSTCPPTWVRCRCYQNTTDIRDLKVTIKTWPVQDPSTGFKKCVASEDPIHVCEEHDCVIVPDNYNELFKGIALSAEESKRITAVDTLKYSKYNKTHSKHSYPQWSIPMVATYNHQQASKWMTVPKQMFFHRGHGNKSRVARGVRECHVPQLQNAEVTCWKWPNWITCEQTCIWGHAVYDESAGGTVTKMSLNCRGSERHWKPSVFRDCEPYVNCKVHLVQAGDLSCYEPTKEAAYCNIDCADYEDQAATGMQRITCDKNLRSQLPFCAQLEDDVHLIDSPRGF